jgi:hypothetical protein
VCLQAHSAHCFSAYRSFRCYCLILTFLTHGEPGLSNGSLDSFLAMASVSSLTRIPKWLTHGGRGKEFPANIRRPAMTYPMPQELTELPVYQSKCICSRVPCSPFGCNLLYWLQWQKCLPGKLVPCLCRSGTFPAECLNQQLEEVWTTQVTDVHLECSLKGNSCYPLAGCGPGCVLYTQPCCVRILLSLDSQVLVLASVTSHISDHISRVTFPC